MQKQFLVRRPAAVESTGMIDDETPGQRDPVRWLIGCGILLIAAIAISTAIMVSNFRDRAIRNAERELESAVLLLARHFDQELDDFGVVQSALAAKVKGQDRCFPHLVCRWRQS